jgi:hypothetical protein
MIPARNATDAHAQDFWANASCYYPACKHSHSAIAYYTVLETIVLISLCVVAELSVAPTNSALVPSTVNTPAPCTSSHLVYGIRTQR